MQRDKVEINADGRILGRVATEIAVLLMGKNKPGYRPNMDEGAAVLVKNADKVKLTGKKADQKAYFHHTGYLGGLKKVSIKKVLKEKPSDILKRAVYGMIPRNKLRRERIKRLIFE